uniref:DUF853 domain-containing protein n=1 Tax=Steinernema glaseri TaxID=37863 RepID=A0A1I7YXJ6_9BILA
MGPLLLAQILELNDTQEGILNILFRVADDEGQLILDLKDLRALLQDISDRAAELRGQYGNIAAASVGAIQRALLRLETQGADRFFGEPALDVMDWIRTDSAGRGMINVLAADKLMQSPRLYAVFLLWMLADLYERLPETAAQTMRPNPGLDIEAAITELGVGEALVSMLDAKGIPTPTERAWLVAPGSRIGPATDAERQTVRQASLFGLKYDQAIDRESAYDQ